MIFNQSLPVRRLVLALLAVVCFTLKPVFAQTNVSCGEDLPASIVPAGEKDSYFLLALNKDRLRLRAYSSASGLDLSVSVFAPNGSVAFFTATEDACGLVEIDSLPLSFGDGSYRIEVSDGVGNQTGSYYISFQLLGKPACATSVGCGEDLPASLTWDGEMDAYRLAASTGDRLRLRLFFSNAAMQGRVDAYNPNGQLVATFAAAGGSQLLEKEDFPLTQGEWQFIVYEDCGDESGSYYASFQVVNRAACATQVDCGEDLPASLTWDGEMDAYRLSAADGDDLRLRVFFSNAAMQGRVDAYLDGVLKQTFAAPPGSQLLEVTYNGIDQGEWFFVVYEEGGDESGSYYASFQILNKPACATQVACGEDLPASLTWDGEMDAYRLAATAGDRLRMRTFFSNAAARGMVDIYFDGLLDTTFATPPGSQLLDFQRTLDQDGEWFFMVYEDGGDEGGSYYSSFQILNKPACATQVSCSEELPASLTWDGEMDAYRLVANEGDKLQLRIFFANAAAQGVVDAYLGGVLQTTFSAAPGSQLLEVNGYELAAGTWFFVVYEEGGDESGSYYPSFQLLKTACATSMACGENKSGSLTWDAEMDAWHFYAETCDTLHLLMVGNNNAFDEKIWLYAPDGTFIASASDPTGGSGSASLVVPLFNYSNGNFIVVVGETQGDDGGSYSLSLTCVSPFTNVNPTTVSQSGDAGTKALDIFSTCNDWTILEDANWLTVSPSGGSGNGTATLFFEENPSHLPRQTTLRVAGCCDTTQVFVSQAGATLTASPTSLNVGAKGGSTTFNVAGTCSDWTILDTVSWLTVSPLNGADPATITVNFDPNPTPNQRIATLKLTGCVGLSVTITVTQAAATLNASPTSLSVSAGAGQTTFEVSGTCFFWEISTPAGWVIVTPSSGSDPATVTVIFEANPCPISRQATLELSGCGITKTIVLTQAGAAFSASPTSLSAPGGAGQLTFNVNGSCGSWEVSENADWVIVFPGSGSGAGTVTVIFEANPTCSIRTVPITITCCTTTVNVTMTQAKASLDVSTNSMSFGQAAGDTSFLVTTEADWTATESANWLTVSPNDGNGPGEVQVFFEQNNTCSSRTATITVTSCNSNKTLSVTQAAATLSPSPTSFEVTSGAGSVTFEVSGTCGDWEILENCGWLNISPDDGTEPQTVTIFFVANPDDGARECTITLLGCNCTNIPIVVEQDGQIFIHTEPDTVFAAWNDTGASFDILSNCDDWMVTCTSGCDWAGNFSPASGSGNEDLDVSFDENTSTTDRTATFLVSGCGINETVMLIQMGLPVIIEVNPDELNVGANLTQVNFEVQSNCVAWNVVENADWFTVTPNDGSGNGTILVVVEENPTASPRSDTIRIVGCGLEECIVVTQGGTPCALATNPALSVQVPADATQTVFTLESNCDSWTISESGWVDTVFPSNGGLGSTLVTVNFTANSDDSPRSAVLTVTGCDCSTTLTIVQAGIVGTATELLPQRRLHVFPNPATTYFEVELPENLPPGGGELLLSDVSGKVLHKLAAKAGERLRVEREGLAAGIYFLRLETAGRLLARGRVAVVE